VLPLRPSRWRARGARHAGATSRVQYASAGGCLVNLARPAPAVVVDEAGQGVAAAGRQRRLRRALVDQPALVALLGQLGDEAGVRESWSVSNVHVAFEATALHIAKKEQGRLILMASLWLVCSRPSVRRQRGVAGPGLGACIALQSRRTAHGRRPERMPSVRPSATTARRLKREARGPPWSSQAFAGRNSWGRGAEGCRRGGEAGWPVSRSMGTRMTHATTSCRRSREVLKWP